MLVAVPTEVKNNEFRVALTQGGVQELVRAGHQVLVQSGAGVGSGASDQDYRDAGAELVDDVDELWERAELVLKVKEPQPEEYGRLRRGQVLFTYLHLAASPRARGRSWTPARRRSPTRRSPAAAPCRCWPP